MKHPLFDRSENKTSTLLVLADREEKMKKRCSDMSLAGIKIHQLLQVVFVLEVYRESNVIKLS